MISGLYAIADAGTLDAREIDLREFAEGLRAAGVQTVQWRCKAGSPQEVLAGAAVLREVFFGSECQMLLNDRVDLALLAGFDGVHVGQRDLSPGNVRDVVAQFRSSQRDRDALGKSPTMGETASIWLNPDWATGFAVGVSTHTAAEARAAEAGVADYVAVGPVFATGSKADAAAVVGLEGVRRARVLTGKPLVAIGGITRENAASVKEAGADAVAVISGLLVPGESVEKVARDFLTIFR